MSRLRIYEITYETKPYSSCTALIELYILLFIAPLTAYLVPSGVVLDINLTEERVGLVKIGFILWVWDASGFLGHEHAFYCDSKSCSPYLTSFDANWWFLWDDPVLANF